MIEGKAIRVCISDCNLCWANVILAAAREHMVELDDDQIIPENPNFSKPALSEALLGETDNLEKGLAQAYYDGVGFDYIGNVSRLKTIVSFIKERDAHTRSEIAGALQKIVDTNSVYFSHDGCPTLAQTIKILEESYQTKKDKK
jgi:hypothetical protein